MHCPLVHFVKISVAPQYVPCPLMHFMKIFVAPSVYALLIGAFFKDFRGTLTVYAVPIDDNYEDLGGTVSKVLGFS